MTMRRYGEMPKSLGTVEVCCKEMMFYQYLPIKLAGQMIAVWEDRLNPFSQLIEKCMFDFGFIYGNDTLDESNVYLTVKHLYQTEGCSFNREGWHSDGFMTDDINYIWSNNNGTIFNTSKFNLTQDHKISIEEMCQQARPLNDYQFQDSELLRLDQYNIHKVAYIAKPTMRTFFKLSFSPDKYNLVGNSHNHLLDYSWEMKERQVTRNHPVKS
ncbi:hypothetical protein [Pedobacter metabolipauper]|uniref:Uncharacterized protein n=1 Tax=Pedobacter metabolipauper TaxID=425513 RepID=A0A4R6T1B5_9SPHI|nr:hypothetical protein [Pedobacter metabolipauper]TDQ12197.1 hypothetical protein ATK78_1331 [Pedobacter metabolipauper]